jgi:hypothetical protein
MQAEVDEDAGAAETDLHALLLPGDAAGRLPRTPRLFALAYAGAVLDGWVRQHSPACCAGGGRVLPGAAALAGGAGLISRALTRRALTRRALTRRARAASVAGAWNAVQGLPRGAPGALDQPALVRVLDGILDDRARAHGRR